MQYKNATLTSANTAQESDTITTKKAFLEKIQLKRFSTATENTNPFSNTAEWVTIAFSEWGWTNSPIPGKLVQWDPFKHIPQTSSREEIHLRKDAERAWSPPGKFLVLFEKARRFRLWTEPYLQHYNQSWSVSKWKWELLPMHLIRKTKGRGRERQKRGMPFFLW